ncbi:MAG: hypothetical protein WBW53_09410 [Terriglobales bacterium]
MVVRWNIAVVVALCLAPALQGQAPFDFKDFSATMSGALSGPNFETKVYRKGDLVRVDMPGHYIVTDVNTLTSYGYFPRTNSCLENSAPQSGSMPFSMLKDAKIEHVPAGEEVVEGHPCKVEDVTIEHESRPPIKLKVWEAQDLKGFPIKIVRESRIVPAPSRTLLYRDVQLGPQDSSLFFRPERCDQAPDAPAYLQSPPAPNGGLPK